MVSAAIREHNMLSALNEIAVGRQRLAVFVAAMTLMYACPALFVVVLTATLIYLLPSYVAILTELRLRQGEAQTHDEAMSRIQYGLDTALARIEELDGDLADARARLTNTRGSGDPLYRRVGLSDGCPDFVVAAARKAYRLKLHPDRVPERLKIAAHARFVAAEAAFDEIERRRR